MHGVHKQPAAIIKKAALFISGLIEMLDLEIQHATGERDLLAARGNVQRVKLHGLHLMNCSVSAAQAFETTTGPKPLRAK